MGSWISENITLPMHATPSEERENAISHFIGLAAAIIGFLAVLAASPSPDHPTSRLGMLIFAATNIILYASSAFYHNAKPGLAKKVLRVLDHSSIYLLIAGSYTPVLLYVGSPITLWYAAGMWIAAAVGILLTIRFWGRFYGVHIALYVAMGWSVLTIYGSVFPFIPAGLFPYALSGGIVYTLGVVFYAIRRIPHNHLIWHFFVIGGSLCFFIGYYIFLLA